jgi:hypothetical protein
VLLKWEADKICPHQKFRKITRCTTTFSKKFRLTPCIFYVCKMYFFCTCKSTLYKPTLASKLPMLKKKKTKGICLSNSAQKPSNETRLGWRTA